MDTSTNSEEFYKVRIENFPIERDIFNNYVELITPNRGELHVLDWEYRSGLENAQFVVEEREKEEADMRRVEKEIVQRRADLKLMKSKQDQRIRQIHRLSELSQPVERDSTYIFEDRYHNKSNLNLYSGVIFTNGPLGFAGEGGEGEDKTNKNESLRVDVMDGKNKSNNVIKSLRTGEIIQLEGKLEDETRKLNTSISELDLALKEVDLGSRTLDAVVMQSLDSSRTEAAELIKEVDKLDYQCYLSVSELLQLRLKIMRAQREELEELSQLKSDKDYFAAREKQMKEQLISDMHLMKKRLRAEALDSTKDFHSQHVTLDKLLEKLRKRYNRLQKEIELHDGSNDKLERVVEAQKVSFLRLKRRHQLEMEGYSSESALLNKKLLKLQKQYREISGNEWVPQVTI